MKTREGFVSNSSTTSFTIVADKKLFIAAFNALHPFYQKVLKYWRESPPTKSFKGEKVVVLNGTYSSEDISDIEWDVADIPKAIKDRMNDWGEELPTEGVAIAYCYDGDIYDALIDQMKKINEDNYIAVFED